MGEDLNISKFQQYHVTLLGSNLGPWALSDVTGVAKYGIYYNLMITIKSKYQKLTLYLVCFWGARWGADDVRDVSLLLKIL